MKSIVVTGAAQGLGLAIASRSLDDGFAVVMVDVNADALEVARESLEGKGSVHAVVGDVALRSTHEHAATIAESLGELDGWVNNAGYNIVAAIHEIDQETYDRGMSVVFGGVFWGTAVAVSRMLETGGGSIVNMSSIHAFTAFPSFPAYAAAKGAIISLSRQVAGEYAGRGIRCNTIAPGLIATSLADEFIASSADPQAVIDSFDALCPIGRWGTVQDVSSAASFLLSDESSFMTGQTMVIDGGATVLARGY